MIARVRSWYSSRRTGTKILVVAAASVVGLLLLYGAARTMQYAAARRAPASPFVPEGAEIVVRVSDLAGRWSAIQQTELWKAFTRRLQKDPAIRSSLNEILAGTGAPTLDQIEDRRWVERHPMLSESSILRYAGRDLVLSRVENKFCMATRVGFGDFLLLPALQLFPRAAGAEPVAAGGAQFLKRGDLFISVQGAIVVVSNDAALLASALRRRGPPETAPGLLRATFRPEPLMPVLRGFPLGGLFAVADVESCRRIDVDVEVNRADLVIRVKAEGLKPRNAEAAPVDTVRMIPANGLGAFFANLEMGSFWEWARRIADRRVRGGSSLDRIARENLGEFVEILHNQGFAEEVVSKLDGPVSVLFGASVGDDGKTYAAIALYMRSSRARDAVEALQGVIDRATEKIRDKLKPTDSEAGGIPFRSYRLEPDPFRYNNFMVPCFAVTGDALILANNRGFLEDALKCRANEESPMAVQLHYQQAMKRLQELGLNKVTATGAVESLFLYGPAIRQGLEGFYRAAASPMVDNPLNRARLKQELETNAAKEGRPFTFDELDKRFGPILEERIAAKEEELRRKARILDYLQWVAFQAEAVDDGMKFEFAVELNPLK